MRTVILAAILCLSLIIIQAKTTSETDSITTHQHRHGRQNHRKSKIAGHSGNQEEQLDNQMDYAIFLGPIQTPLLLFRSKINSEDERLFTLDDLVHPDVKCVSEEVLPWL